MRRHHCVAGRWPVHQEPTAGFAVALTGWSETRLDVRGALLARGDPKSIDDFDNADEVRERTPADEDLDLAGFHDIGAVIEVEAEALDRDRQGHAPALAGLKGDLLERLQFAQWTAAARDRVPRVELHDLLA